MNPDDTQQNNQSINQGDPMDQSDVDMFPSFLNNPDGAFNPSQMSGLDPQLQDPNNSGSQTQIVASPGSPESGGAIVVESQQGSPEYNTEVQSSSESPEIESVESKDAVKPQVNPDVPSKPKIEEKSKTEEKQDSKAPKIFGYLVPEKVMSDFKKIQDGKIMGSPDSADVWVYMLLDRLLKSHSAKS